MIAVLWSLMVGCMAPTLKDTGSGLGPGDDAMGGGCEPIDTRTVGFDEDLGGYTASQVVARVLGTHSKTLTWNTGASTGLTLSVTGATEAVFVDQEVVSAGDEAIEIACDDALQITMGIRVVTVDGQLNFEAPVVLIASGIDAQQVSVSLDRPDVLFRASEWVSEPYDTLTSALVADWLDGALSGTITAQAQSSSGGGSEGIEMVSNIQIAAF
tara:strand:+ start:320 stop:958 length:639 start_codon:yes stop_codon:yes gene_type:complete